MYIEPRPFRWFWRWYFCSAMFTPSTGECSITLERRLPFVGEQARRFKYDPQLADMWCEDVRGVWTYGVPRAILATLERERLAMKEDDERHENAKKAIDAAKAEGERRRYLENQAEKHRTQARMHSTAGCLNAADHHELVAAVYEVGAEIAAELRKR